jgi:hypothetical protein
MAFGVNPVLTIQYAGPEHGNNVSFTNLERTKVAVPESNQLLSDMKAVMFNKDIVQDEFEETSDEVGLAEEHEEKLGLSDISEDIHSTTSKGKEIVVGPEAALCEWASQNEFQDNHTLIGDNKDSRRCGLLKTGRCEFATDDGEMDPNGITETPTNGFGVSVWRAVHDLTLISFAIFVVILSRIGTIVGSWKEECAGKTSVKQKIEPQCTYRTMDPRTRQTDAFDLWMEEGCWIYMIQGADGRMWGKSYRDLQIHHDQPY